MSSRLTAVLGYPACSLLGESLFNLIHTADIQNVQAAFLKRECLAKKVPITITIYISVQTKK